MRSVSISLSSISPSRRPSALELRIHFIYRASHLLIDWFRLTWILSVPLKGIWQKQLGKMMEHPNQSQPNPGLRADGTPCTYATIFCAGKCLHLDLSCTVGKDAVIVSSILKTAPIGPLPRDRPLSLQYQL